MSQEEKRNKNVVVLKLVLGDSILILVPNLPFENVFFNLIPSFSFLVAQKKAKTLFVCTSNKLRIGSLLHVFPVMFQPSALLAMDLVSLPCSFSLFGLLVTY